MSYLYDVVLHIPGLPCPAKALRDANNELELLNVAKVSRFQTSPTLMVTFGVEKPFGVMSINASCGIVSSQALLHDL